jgi:uncharacterized membrane protein YqgA involved in biofilm formation
MRGTLLNTATVAGGALIGLEAGKYIPPNFEKVVLDGLGLVVCLMGARMFAQSKNIVIVIASVALGGVIGAAIGIAPALSAFAEWTRARLGGGGRFNEGLVFTSVLFCVGPMTLLGCLQDGIEGNIELLAVKSTLDGIGSIFFAAAFGPAVLVTAAVVLVFQGALTLCARRLQNLAKDEEMLAEVTAVGGAVMLGIAFGLLDIKKVRMETYLPSLAIAPLILLATRKVRVLRNGAN